MTMLAAVLIRTSLMADRAVPFSAEPPVAMGLRAVTARATAQVPGTVLRS